MFRIFSYYSFHAFINQIKKLLRTWVVIFFVCCFGFGIILGFVFNKLEKMENLNQLSSETAEIQTESTLDIFLNEFHVEKIEFAEMVCGLAVIFVFILIVLISNNSKNNDSAGFIPADINVLFTSPLSPQNVLLFRLFCQLGSMIFLTIYYLIEVPALLNFGFNIPSAIAFIFSFGLIFIFSTLLKTLIYLFTSNKGKYKKIVNYLPLFIIGIIFIVTIIYSSITGTEFIQSVVNVLKSKNTRYIPIFGWIKSLPFIVLEGRYITAILIFIISLILIVILVIVIKNIKCDYYEEAAGNAERALAKSKKMKLNGLFSLKRKKSKGIRKKNDNLLFKGKGEYMFFSKQMYLRKKFAFLGIFTNSSYTFLAAGLLSTIIFLNFDIDINYLPVIVGFVYGIIAFYFALKNPIMFDIKTVYFRLAIGNEWKKMFWSLFAGSVTCFLDMLPGIILCDIAGILLGGDIVSIIVSSLIAILFISSLYFYSSNVGSFICLSIPENVSFEFKQVIQIIFIYFGLIPDALFMVLCYNTLPLTVLMLIATLINMLIGFFFMSFLPLLLWPSSKDVIQYEKIVKEEDLKKESMSFSYVGAGLAISLLVTFLLQNFVPEIINNINSSLLESEYVSWALSFVPVYLIGIPLSYLFIRKVPIKKIEKTKLSSKAFIEAGIALFSLGYIVNIANRLLLLIFQVLGDFSIENVVESFILNKTNWILIIIVVIVGPLFEELLFRKIIIDRLNIYGGKIAIIVSAIMFGLFHGNIEQTPYAMALGLVLAYVYQRSGNIIYSWILHMIFNLNGTLISLKVMESNNTTLITIYLLIILAIILIGIVVMAVKARELKYVDTVKLLPKKGLFKTVFINPGMILMYITCFSLIIYNLMYMIH